MNDYLIGYRFGITWINENESEEYLIVKNHADVINNEVNIDTPFAQSLINKNKGDVCVSKGNNFKIEYIICPEFQEFCNDRNIKKLYHFTNVKNLDSIMKYGIFSINELKNNNIKYVFNDNLRLDRHNDFISCSIEFPNSKLLSVFRKANLFLETFVILEIDIDLLNYKYSLCSPINAASQGGTLIRPIREISSLFIGDRENYPQNFPTSEQAEILIKTRIDTQYIKKIIFENKLDEIKYKKNYNTEVNPKLFDFRDHYLRSYW